MPRLRLVDRMRAAKTVEEDLRPDLPATIKPGATWLLEAKLLMDESPEAYAGLVACMADGESNRSLSKRTSLPIELIRKIRELHPQAIEAGRKATHARLEEALQSTVERLVDSIDKIPARQLALQAAILVDKVQLVTGGATQRVETIQAPTKKDLDQLFNALPVADAQVISEDGRLQESTETDSKPGNRSSVQSERESEKLPETE